MKIITAPELVEKIEQFLKRTGLPASTFGRKIANNPALMNQLREGVIPRLDTAGKILDYMGRMSALWICPHLGCREPNAGDAAKCTKCKAPRPSRSKAA